MTSRPCPVQITLLWLCLIHTHTHHHLHLCQPGPSVLLCISSPLISPLTHNVPWGENCRSNPIPSSEQESSADSLPTLCNSYGFSSVNILSVPTLCQVLSWALFHFLLPLKVLITLSGGICLSRAWFHVLDKLRKGNSHAFCIFVCPGRAHHIHSGSLTLDEWIRTRMSIYRSGLWNHEVVHPQ